MPARFSLIAAIAMGLAALPALAQVSVGGVQVGVPGAGQVLDPVLDRTDRLAGDVTREALDLAEDRVRRIDRLVRRNRATIERDARGEPARRGELVVLTDRWQDALLSQLEGYGVIETGVIDGLDIGFARVAVPRGTRLAEAEAELAALLPDATVTSDNLYFQSGGDAEGAVRQDSAGSPFNRSGAATRVGMIDGAPGSATPIAAMRGFADGAGVASDHGSAVASLLRGAGAPRIHAADVYGNDRAGGNALAIARALGWMAGEGVEVVSISLVGPDNPVLARAIAVARQRGLIVVAAVGNDGPAAPPAFPASYNGVVAVTGVDRRERALIEAGRAAHLDYAAPGADIYGLDRRGRQQRLRGTSYATPLVAARIALALGAGRAWRSTLDAEARDLGESGPDEVFGRGLVCRGCGAR